MGEFNILLTSAGRRSYLVKYFKQALGREGRVLTTNSVQPYPASCYSDVSLTVPYAFEPEFEQVLTQIVVDHNIRMLFSFHDWEAPYIAAFAEKLRGLGSIPVIADQETLKICLDKYATFQFLQKNDLPSPQTFLSAEASLAAFDRGEIDFPLMIKPRYGQGSIDLLRADDPRELRGYFELLRSKNRTGGFNMYHSENLFIVQEYITGQEYGLNVLSDLEGNYVESFTLRKLAMRHGETDSAVVEDHTDIIETGEQLGKILSIPGVLDADVFMTASGPLILELNPRFGGQYPFLHSAGIDIPRWLIALGQGRTPNSKNLKGLRGQTFMKSIEILHMK
jgi:carbamoyl-phosphate synthase large subunit